MGDTNLNPANNTFAELIKDMFRRVRKLENTTQPAFSDWLSFNPSEFTYSSNNNATVSEEISNQLSIGDTVRIFQGGAYKYFYLSAKPTSTSIRFSGGLQTFTNASFTDIGFGRKNNPTGHPVIIEFDPNLDALGATYTPGVAAGLKYYFSMQGRQVTIIAQDLGGASVDNDCILYFDLPVPAENITTFLYTLLNNTSTVGQGYIANDSFGLVPPQNYGVLFKTVADEPLNSGGANHYLVATYVAEA